MSIVHRKLKPVDQNVGYLALETEMGTENKNPGNPCLP